MSTPPAVDITIVVSTHNRASRLNRLLTTLLVDQKPGGVAYEVIVVDNNSTDDTAQVLEAWCARFGTQLRRLFEGQRGVSYGRNAGVMAARGAVVAFTDDDNEPSPNWISTIARVFREIPALEICGGKLLPCWTTDVPRWLDRRHWSPVAILDYGDEPFWTSAERPICL